MYYQMSQIHIVQHYKMFNHKIEHCNMSKLWIIKKNDGIFNNDIHSYLYVPHSFCILSMCHALLV